MLEALFEIVVDLVFGLIGAAFSWLFHTIFPNAKMKHPPQGDLGRKLSSHLQQFVAALPRNAGDPLGAVCFPVVPEQLRKLPLNLKYLLPLWMTGDECYAIWQPKGFRGQPRFGMFFPKRKKIRTMSFGDSEQALLAVLMTRVLERQDWADPARAAGEAQRAASIVGYRYLDETMEWFRDRRETNLYDREFDVEEFAGTIAARTGTT